MSENLSSIDPVLQGGDSSLSPGSDPASRQGGLDGSAQPTDTTVGRSDPIVAHKKFPLFSVLLLLILSVVSVIAVYLFLQVRELSMSQPIPSPSPSPLASIDPTSDWQTYSDVKNNFSLKYPKDWEQFESDSKSIFQLTKSISEKDIVLEKCDQSNGCISAANIELEIKNLPEDYNYNLSPCKIFGECLLAEKTERKTNGDVIIIMEYLRKDSIYPIYSYIFIKNTSVIKVSSYLPSTKNCTGKINGVDCGAQEDSVGLKTIGQELVGILSTFEFTDTSTSYTCPASGYVDCMPSPDGPKPSCTKEAMEWYKTNCPDFQGGAL